MVDGPSSMCRRVAIRTGMNRKEMFPVHENMTFRQLYITLSRRLLGSAEISGLKARPDLNGIVVSVPAKSTLRDGRVEVETTPGKRIRLKLENLLQETRQVSHLTLDGARLGVNDRVADVCAHGDELVAVFCGGGHAGPAPLKLAPTCEDVRAATSEHTRLPSQAPVQSQRVDQEPLSGSSATELLSGLGLEPSERQKLRAELMDRAAIEALFGDSLDGVLFEETREREEILKARIRKMLELAFHPKTGEAESGQALRNAQKLMREHHLEQSEVLMCRGEVQNDDGGLHGVRLTPADRTKEMRVSHEYWTQSLMKAVELTFDVAGFSRRDKGHNANYIIFYGRRAGTELAAFAYTCAFNRIDWMAGNRALPPDQFFANGHEHAGKRFSEILRLDPGYVVWAKSQERKRGGVCKQLEMFVEYALAWQNTSKWDQAYKNGVASTLQKTAEAAQKSENVTTDALAISSKAVQNRVLDRMGLNISCKRKLSATSGFKCARRRGSIDAANVNLRQQQLETEELAALPDSDLSAPRVATTAKPGAARRQRQDSDSDLSPPRPIGGKDAARHLNPMELAAAAADAVIARAKEEPGLIHRVEP